MGFACHQKTKRQYISQNKKAVSTVKPGIYTHFLVYGWWKTERYRPLRSIGTENHPYCRLDWVNEVLCRRCPALVNRKKVLLFSTQAHKNWRINKIVRKGRCFTSSVLIRFNTYRFSFVSIARTFHN